MFRNISIAKKNIVAFGSIILVVAAFSIFVFLALTQIETANRESALASATMATSQQLLSQLVEKQNAMRGFAASLNDEFLAKMDAAGAKAADLLTKFEAAVQGTHAESTIAPLKDAVAVFDAEAAATVDNVRQPGTIEDARKNIASVARLSKVREALTAYTEAETAEEATRDATLAAAFEAGRMTLVIGGAVAALIALAMGLILSRGIGRPISLMTAIMRRLADGDVNLEVPEKARRDEIGAIAAAVEVFRANAIEKSRVEAEALANRSQADKDRAAAEASKAQQDAKKSRLAVQQAMAVAALSDGLSRVARGDLSVTIDTHFDGDLDALRHAFNDAIGKFADIVSQLRMTSSQLKSATGEILSGANDLAERTTKQAAAIEETSAAMEQLSSTVIENAKRAEQASSKAQNVSDTAAITGEVMTRSNEAMERISSSSAKISNIIGLIDDIAFQTNLLALNASVEAARAGDAGKGFAVVAVEVRRLAQSAASASSEVKLLIEQSAGEVTAGSKLVAEATQKLVDMLGSVKESAELIKDISSASRQQSSAIAEVSTAIRQMDEMTQHNAALVEETNAAIEQTENQANDLDRIVDQFVVDARSTRAAAAVPAPHQQPAAPATGIKALQQKVKAAASSYLSKGNVALKDDWNEF